MSDAEDLARRYLALWQEYLTALLSDPAGTELLWGWAFGDRAPHDGGTAAGPAAGAAPVAGASDECRRTVAKLTDRVAVLEERVTALEQRGEQGGRSPARPRRRNRRVRV
jgi:hypothetical protein